MYLLLKRFQLNKYCYFTTFFTKQHVCGRHFLGVNLWIGFKSQRIKYGRGFRKNFQLARKKPADDIDVAKHWVVVDQMI